MGSLLTESFFGIPGLGSYTIDAINAQDFAVVRAMVFIGSVLYIVGLILTDISYTLVDPRVRLRMTRLQARHPLDRRADLALLVAAGIGIGVVRRQAASICAPPWRRVGAQPRRHGRGDWCCSPSSLIGLLDSLHYRAALAGKAGDRAAVLGRGAVGARRAGWRRCARATRRPIRRRWRRSLYAKETVELPDGEHGARLSAPASTAARISANARTRCRTMSGAASPAGAGLAPACWLVGIAGRLASARAHGSAAVRRLAAAIWRGETALRLGRGAGVAARACCCWSPCRVLRAGRRATTCSAPTRSGRTCSTSSLKSIRTGLVIGTLTTLVMLPLARAARHHGRLFPRLGRRRHPVRLHHAELDSRRAADRRRGADDAGVSSTPIRTGSTPRPSAPTCACWRCA